MRAYQFGLVAITACGLLATAQAALAQFGPANVVVSPVVQRDVVASRTFVGSAVAIRKAIVGSAVDGRVLEFLLNPEDPKHKLMRVQARQPIAQLRTGTIELEIAASKATRDLREAELVEARETHEDLIKQAETNLQAAKAQLEYAKSKWERNRELFQRSGTVSQEEMELSRSNWLKAYQEEQRASLVFRIVQRSDKIIQAEASLAIADEEKRRLEDIMDKYTVRAPFDGYIVAEHTEVGAWIRSGEPVAEVLSLDPIEIEVNVPEEYVAKLRTGAPAQVSIDALPDLLLTGAITRIMPQADVRARTFPVRIEVDNPERDGDHLIKAGMMAHVHMAVGQKQPSLLIPKDALVLGGKNPMVYLVGPDPKDPKAKVAIPVPVQIGVADGDHIQITAGLQAGQQVVVEGNERLLPMQALIISRVLGETPSPR